MPITLTKAETQAAVRSLQTYARQELEIDLSDLRAGLLLDFFQKDLAPFAYNQGVRDAESFLRAKLEDLSATCFEDPLTYWRKK